MVSSTAATEVVGVVQQQPPSRPANGVEALIHSVQFGDLEFVRNAIEKEGANANTRDLDNCSLLHWAAINNRVKIARYLISRGAVVNAVGGQLKETPLQWACRNDKFTFMVRLLVKEGRSDLQHKSIHGLDALHVAVRYGCVKIAFMLLQYGSNPNTTDILQETPLLWLFKNKMQESVDLQRLLLRYGANVLVTDRDQNNLLHITAGLGSQNADVIAAMKVYEMGYKDLINMKNRDNRTALEVAWRKRDGLMLQFLCDMYMYTHYPHCLPVVTTALLVPLSFILLEHMGWLRFVVILGITVFVWEKFSQPTLYSKTSRKSNGAAWGIILTLLWYFIGVVMNLVHRHWKYVIFTLTAIIAYTLYLSAATLPGHIARNKSMQRRSRLMNGVIMHGIYEGLEEDKTHEFKPRNENDFEIHGSSNSLNELETKSVTIRNRRDGDNMDVEAIGGLYGNNSHGNSSLNMNSNGLNNSNSNNVNGSNSSGNNISGSNLMGSNSGNNSGIESNRNLVADDDDDDDEKKRLLPSSLTETFRMNVHNEYADGAFDGDDDDNDDDDDIHEPDWSHVKKVKLCTTCLVDKSYASIHCMRCDLCVVDLDHHCPFVNNCVGPGNRRAFIIFTISASIACLIYSILALSVEYNVFCPGYHSTWSFFDVQYCMLKKMPSFALAAYLCMACVLWIGSIGFGQLGLICEETTTFEVLRGVHRGDNCDCSPKGWKSLFRFCWTGNYKTKHSPLPQTVPKKSSNYDSPLKTTTPARRVRNSSIADGSAVKAAANV